MQRFKVHSHSQAVSPTHRSLQPVASSGVQTLLCTNREPNLSLVENPFSWVLFLMCLVVDCSEKSVKSGYFGVIIYNWWRKVQKIGIFANQNAHFTKNSYEDPEYSGFSP